MDSQPILGTSPSVTQGETTAIQGESTSMHKEIPHPVYLLPSAVLSRGTNPVIRHLNLDHHDHSGTSHSLPTTLSPDSLLILSDSKIKGEHPETEHHCRCCRYAAAHHPRPPDHVNHHSGLPHHAPPTSALSTSSPKWKSAICRKCKATGHIARVCPLFAAELIAC